MARIYVASSWRNEWQPLVVECLRNHGHEVYDFKNPRDGDKGFHWSDIDPGWKQNGEPELMVKVFDHICCHIDEVVAAIDNMSLNRTRKTASFLPAA